MNIYEFFNSRDIAEYCRDINYKFTAIETAYIVWHSNHHTLADKHQAWQEIIDTMPDETFRPNWDFDGYTLHSFLRTYMRLQNEYIENFRSSKEAYIYTYATLRTDDDRWSTGDIFFGSYETCLNALRINELDDDPDCKIRKAKIIRHRLYAAYVSSSDAKEAETIEFDRRLRPIELESACETEGERRFLSPAYGFYEMWVAIPTPFCKGDIVTDVEVYHRYGKEHLPFVLERIPYWRKDARNGDDSEAQIERLLNIGVDWTDMQMGAYFLDDNGELYWNHAFDYLDLEYFRDKLHGTEKFLLAVSKAIKGLIGVEELLQSHSIMLMEKQTAEMRRCSDDNRELMRLCGLGEDK